MRRRFLDEFEQRVEPFPGHHVRLVDDVDLVPRVHRRKERALPQVTGVVDTTVGGGVDLDDVDTAAAVGGQRHARVALPARVRRGTFRTVQRPSQNPRAGGLPAAAWTAEQVGVVHPPVPQRLTQGFSDMLLAAYFSEGRGTVFAVQGDAHGALTSPSADQRCGVTGSSVVSPPTYSTRFR